MLEISKEKEGYYLNLEKEKERDKKVKRNKVRKKERN